MKLDDETTFNIGLLGLLFVITACLITLAAFAIHADGRPDYCFTEANPTGVVANIVLVAHRPWRGDTAIQIVNSAKEAAEAAAAIGCPLK